MEQRKLWFKAKLYGWGWQPMSWEGWLITFLYVALNVWYYLRTDAGSYSVSDTLIGFSPFFIVTTILLLIVCYKKGEKPGWHWGNVSDKPHP